MSENAWRSFWATAIEGEKPADVAKRLGTTVGNVYTAKCRVFARIRTVAARLDVDDPHGDATFDTMAPDGDGRRGDRSEGED